MGRLGLKYMSSKVEEPTTKKRMQSNTDKRIYIKIGLYEAILPNTGEGKKVAEEFLWNIPLEEKDD